MQERREADANAQREQARREIDADDRPDVAAAERAAFARICREHSLEVVEMPPDGHWCALPR